MVHGSFEAWDPTTSAPFDLVFAATAWHWLDPEVRYARAWQALRPGGHLAFWSATHVFPDDGDPFFREIQPVYDEIGEGLPADAPWPRPGDLDDHRDEIERTGLFTDVHVRHVDWETVMDADGYIALLDTFSGHIAMQQWQRDRLYGEIRRRLGDRPSGRVRRHWGAVAARGHASGVVVSETYAAVDESSDVASAVDWQERIDAWPAIAAYKARIDALVAGSEPVVDVGCGPGTDAARSPAVGVDRSRAMATRASSRGVPVVVGDAAALPLGDDAMGAVRSDRVLQHVRDPHAAIAEMARVIRPGGRIAIADPDQESLVIHVPGVPADLVDGVRRLRRDVGYRNGRLVTRLPAMLAAMGAADVTIDAFPLVLRDPADAFGIATWVDHWRDQGGFSNEDDALWRGRLDGSRDAGFVYAVTYFVVGATLP